MDHLLDLKWIKKHTPNLENLKVKLEKSPVKGTSLFAQKPIKKGNIIAYYHMKVYPLKTPGPFGDVYQFTVYTSKGNAIKNLVGNLYEGSLKPPKRGIPYWAYFSNEPSGTQKENAYVDADADGNYKNRTRIKAGDTVTFKLIAKRNIAAGEEVVWCYGDEYLRNYKPNCD